MTRASIPASPVLACLLALGALGALGACKSAGMGPEAHADIAAQMRKAEGPIQACYADALKQNRRLRGRISTRLTAEGGTGQFKNVNVLRDEPADPELTRCVVTELGKLKLDKPTKTSLLVDQPINLMPSN
jgi:hypothetical protein